MWAPLIVPVLKPSQDYYHSRPRHNLSEILVLKVCRSTIHMLDAGSYRHQLRLLQTRQCQQDLNITLTVSESVIM